MALVVEGWRILGIVATVAISWPLIEAIIRVNRRNDTQRGRAMNKLVKPTVETVLYLPAIIPFAIGVAAIVPITGLVEWMDKGQPNRLLVWSAWAVLYWPLTLLGAIGMALMAPFVVLMEWADTPDYRPDKRIREGLDLLADVVRYRPA